MKYTRGLHLSCSLLMHAISFVLLANIWSWLYWYYSENEETEALWGKSLEQGNLDSNWEVKDEKLKSYGPKPSYFVKN